MDSKGYIGTLIENAAKAQKIIDGYDQNGVDRLVRAIAKVIYDNAEQLARMAVDETGMGVYEDKVKKNAGKSRIIWNSLKNKKSVGVIRRDAETGVTEIARPVGIVGAVTPCTNPIVTPMCNAMFALKGRNAIIIAPHPRAKKCARVVTDLMNDELRKLGAPENLIQVIDEPSVELSGELMKAVDVVVATGGMAMVKAAYSSGKPAFGVGVGNVQCIIDRGMDLDDVAKKVIAGRMFDNGIICSGEQTIIAAAEEYEAVKAAFARNGAYISTESAEKEKIRKALFPDGVMNKNLVGQSAVKVAETAGIRVPEGTKVIIVEADGFGKSDLMSKEKMCPVISSYRYGTFEEAVEIAQANLNVEGRGHSVSIHSDDAEHIEYAAQRLTVSRVLVNQICSTMNGGSFYNGFTATTTLGCGSWGNNSISENFDYKHLLNITRIGYYNKDAKVPTDDEIWEDKL